MVLPARSALCTGCTSRASYSNDIPEIRSVEMWKNDTESRMACRMQSRKILIEKRREQGKEIDRGEALLPFEGD